MVLVLYFIVIIAILLLWRDARKPSFYPPGECIHISNGVVKVFLVGQMTLPNESEIDRFKLVPWINKNQIYSSDRVLS